ncbi:MAG: hypothetical protein QNI84_11780 [Henriciella sp.]|nr:hypothetical protein [Henriciella sp.]
MPDFADDAIYIWSITVLGLAVPIVMAALTLLRVRLAKQRLERLQKDELPK